MKSMKKLMALWAILFSLGAHAGPLFIANPHCLTTMGGVITQLEFNTDLTTTTFFEPYGPYEVRISQGGTILTVSSQIDWYQVGAQYRFSFDVTSAGLIYNGECFDWEIYDMSGNNPAYLIGSYNHTTDSFCPERHCEDPCTLSLSVAAYRDWKGVSLEPSGYLPPGAHVTIYDEDLNVLLFSDEYQSILVSGGCYTIEASIGTCKETVCFCPFCDTDGTYSGKDWKVFPIPLVDQLTIAPSDNNPGGMINVVVIRDQMNNLVFKQNGLNQSNFSMNCSQWPSGVYFIEINGNETIKAVK